MNEERLLQVLMAPQISEKATFVADKYEQVIFCVLADATKRNVFDQGGAGMVDQKQNEALGAVLALL